MLGSGWAAAGPADASCATVAAVAVTMAPLARPRAAINLPAVEVAGGCAVCIASASVSVSSVKSGGGAPRQPAQQWAALQPGEHTGEGWPSCWRFYSLPCAARLPSQSRDQAVGSENSAQSQASCSCSCQSAPQPSLGGE